MAVAMLKHNNNKFFFQAETKINCCLCQLWRFFGVAATSAYKQPVLNARSLCSLSYIEAEHPAEYNKDQRSAGGSGRDSLWYSEQPWITLLSKLGQTGMLSKLLNTMTPRHENPKPSCT